MELLGAHMWEPLENQIRGMFILIAFSVRGDTSSELGIFEKLDRKIRNCTLGWMVGSRKRVAVTCSNLKWFTTYLISYLQDYAIQVRRCFSKEK